MKTADTDDTGGVDLTDTIYYLNALFLGGPLPPAPWMVCGEDPTPDNLTCEEYFACR
jgi:hypothetical protein